MNIFERPLAIRVPALQGELWTTQCVLQRKLYIDSCACLSMTKVSITSLDICKILLLKVEVFSFCKNN